MWVQPNDARVNQSGEVSSAGSDPLDDAEQVGFYFIKRTNVLRNFATLGAATAMQ